MKEYSRGKVSIIIGLFNVSNFLEEKMLSCVRNQSYGNLEIILVNDGSTDNTPAICQRIALEDSRILLINQDNGGLGSARNAGLDAATGEFVWFYDVDDEVDLSLVEKNVKWMQQYGVDMTVFGMHFTYPDNGQVDTSHFENRVVESNDELRAIIADKLLLVPNGNGFVINKFYRREFIDKNNVRFGWQRIQQDELFNLKLYPLINRIYISSEPLYHYFIYSTGNSRSRCIPDRILIYESIFDGFQEFMSTWNLHTPALEEYSYHRLYQGIESSVLFNTFHPDAPSANEWKKHEVNSILNRPKVRMCLNHMVENNNFNLEGRLYLRAFYANNYPSIRFLRFISNNLRKMKHTLLGENC
jgi:glycosyltransferase involved in cell wall biosynthesis